MDNPFFGNRGTAEREQAWFNLCKDFTMITAVLMARTKKAKEFCGSER